METILIESLDDLFQLDEYQFEDDEFQIIIPRLYVQYMTYDESQELYRSIKQFIGVAQKNEYEIRYDSEGYNNSDIYYFNKE